MAAVAPALYAEGDHAIAETSIVGDVTKIICEVDRPSDLNVKAEMAIEVSLDGGKTWSFAGGFTTNNTVPKNWPGKDDGAPLPKPGLTIQYLDKDGAAITLASPILRGSLKVIGGTMTAAAEMKGA